MADDPWAGSKPGTYTVKFHKDYDAPWYVAAGTPSEIKDQLVEFFGLDAESVADKAPFEVALECTQIGQAAYLVSKGLKASVAKDDDPIANKRQGASEGRKSGWPGSAKAQQPKEPEHPFQGVLDQIAAATTKAELGRVWATNKDSFNNEDVKKAADEKAKTLS